MSLWTVLAAAPEAALAPLLARLRWPDLGLELADHLPPHAWQSLRLHCDPACEIGLFFLPRGQSIPLHDHPAMHVYMRVLLGALHVTSYTRTDELVARRTADTTLDPSSPVWHVEPRRDNLHALHAVTDVAFLDVLRPPYVDGRTCTYYVVTPAGADLWRLHPTD